MKAQPDASPSSYVRVCELAEGGMGRVDLALRREGRFQRLYAIKRLQPHLRDDPEFRQMFLEEARLAGLVRHPNVIGVLDVGQDEGGPYLVMDFVEGLALSTILGLAKQRDESLSVQACVRIAAQIADGLHAAHEVRGHDGQALHLVHRDLSPQNVLVGYDGVVRITDFGIAKAGGRGMKTSTGILKGKMAYMSPEQLQFEEPDRRSDLFALGVVLYEMLSGDRLYRNSEGADGARRILNEPPPDVGEVRPEVPPALVQLLFSLLAKKPDDRPSTAAEVSRRLEEILVELLQDEAAEQVDVFVQALGGDRRTEQRDRIQQALTESGRVRAPLGETQPFELSLIDGAADAVTVAHVFDVDTRPVVPAGGSDTTERMAREMRGSVRWPWIVGATAVAALVLALVAVSVGERGGDSPALAAPPSERETEPSSAEVVAEDVAEVEVEEGSLEGDAEQAGQGAAAQAASEAADAAGPTAGREGQATDEREVTTDRRETVRRPRWKARRRTRPAARMTAAAEMRGSTGLQWEEWE